MTAPLAVRCAGEAVGTALLVGIGCGAIVAAANAGGVPQWVLAVAWFVAVAVPVFTFARLSGSHINPAVTLALVASRRFPWRESFAYVGSQVAGAFLGTSFVWLLVGNADHLGAALPRDGNLWLILPLEIPFTVGLVLVVLYLTKPGRKIDAVSLLLPATWVAFATLVIGPWTGSSMNPARSLAPGVLSGDLLGIGLYLLSSATGALIAVAIGSRLSLTSGSAIEHLGSV